jgi:hypothetical protein
LAGKSTLNRLERGGAALTRYHLELVTEIVDEGGRIHLGLCRIRKRGCAGN